MLSALKLCSTILSLEDSLHRRFTLGSLKFVVELVIGVSKHQRYEKGEFVKGVRDEHK